MNKTMHKLGRKAVSLLLTVSLLLGILPVIAGAVMHNASTILVVGNSLRIFFYDMHEPMKHT